MKGKILIRRNIKANDVSKALDIIRTKYPFAKIITYKFNKDFRFTRKRDYINRTMNVAFINNTKDLREEL